MVTCVNEVLVRCYHRPAGNFVFEPHSVQMVDEDRWVRCGDDWYLVDGKLTVEVRQDEDGAPKDGWVSFNGRRLPLACDAVFNCENLEAP